MQLDNWYLTFETPYRLSTKSVAAQGNCLRSKGKFLKNLVLFRWVVLRDNLVLPTGFRIMWIGHLREIQKLTFQALALRRSEGLTLETSAFWSLLGGQFMLATQLKKPNYLVWVVVQYYFRIAVVEMGFKKEEKPAQFLWREPKVLQL